MNAQLEQNLPTFSVEPAKLYPMVAFMPPADRMGRVLRLVCVIDNEPAVADVNVMDEHEVRLTRLVALCENRVLSDDGWRTMW